MSSSNLVRLAAIAETTYGETPVAGDFSTVRYTSEGLSGTPNTVESAQIRTDRMSSGQIVTGLDVGGDVSFELAKEPMIDSFMESAMYNVWATLALVTVDLTIAVGAKTITRATGDFTVAIKVGDVLTLSGFASALNNTQVIVTEVTSATVIKYAGPLTMVNETGAGTAFKRADKLSIGTTKKSFSMEKTFLDLADKAINYRGMIVASMKLDIAFGALINGSFSFSGSDYLAVDAAGDFMTDGRTIDPAATTSTMNGSIDLPFLASDVDGIFENTNFCIQTLSLSLDNNLSPQTCIGDIAPEDYTPGTASIPISLSTYLRDGSWGLLGRKLSQESFSLGFLVRNAGGVYGFYLPAIQVSFDDPSSGGANQEVTLDMSGQAKVGANGESALVIYRI